MPLLPKYFGKRDKLPANHGTTDPSPERTVSFASSKSSEYVLPDINSDADGSDTGHRIPSPSKQGALYSDVKGSLSTSKLKMSLPNFRRKATMPDKFPTSPRSSSSTRDTLEPPPSRASIFAAFGRSNSSQSLPSQPSKSGFGAPQLPPINLPDQSLFKRPSPVTPPMTLPVPKTPEMRAASTVKIFNRGSKPTKMNEAPRLDLQIPSSSSQDPLESFNLRSFRPVRPVSPLPSNSLDLHPPPVFIDQPISQSPTSLAPPSPIGGSPRQRGSSMGSDASQKITVAQFRQAQLESAKNRSSVHLPVPENPSDSMPPGNVPLHMNLSRPVSPSFALAASKSVNAGGNESGGENGTPSRPERLLPPQAIGRSSPIPRDRSRVMSSPGLRPQSAGRPQDGSRLSAKWMVATDSDSSEDTTSDDITRWTSKKPPLIADFRKGANSPKPSEFTNPISSSVSSPVDRVVMSASKSDLGHSSSGTARNKEPSTSAPPSTATHVRSKSPFVPPPIPTQNIKPGQYSGEGSRPRSPSVMTMVTGESEVWSNTHSTVHSRQGSTDQIFKQGQRAMAKSDLGHDGSTIKRSAGIRRRGTSDKLQVPSKPLVPRSQSTNVLTQPSPSSFVVPRTATAPVETDSDSEGGRPSSTDEDAPLSTLMSHRVRDPSTSGKDSASPVSSAATLPVRGQSPARSTRSAATHLPRSSLNGLGPAPTSHSVTTPDSRKVSANSTTDLGPKEQTPEPKSPLPRSQTSLIDLSSPSSTVVSPPPRQMTAPPSTTISRDGPQLASPSTSGQGLPSVDAAHRQSPAAKSSALRPGPSSTKIGQEHFIRPFVRGDSPASSVGNSSIGSGRFPATPGTGSDAGVSIGNTQSIITTSSGSSGNEARQGRRRSITFDDSVTFSPKKSLHRREVGGSSNESAGLQTTQGDQDAKRNERRRHEAKASLELGRIVNGPVPVDPEDDEDHTILVPQAQNPPQNRDLWQSMLQSQQMQAMGMNPPSTTPGMSPLSMYMNMNMGNPMFNPLVSQMNMGNVTTSQQMFNPMMQTPIGMQSGMGMPMGFNLPPVPPMPNMMMGMDPSMMAAHQQAMAMAKQAYQMAAAQQAIIAAGDEWERSSNMGGFGGASRPPTLFGTPSGSVYGGGSLLGVGGPVGGSIWGGSAYGEAFGPAQQQHDRRQMGTLGNQYRSSLEAEDIDTRGQARKRSTTSPSTALPPAHLRGAGAPPLPPPSSWRPS